MVCNAICNVFVMVLEFSVMVLSFSFRRVASLFLYNAFFFVILKAVVFYKGAGNIIRISSKG